MLEPQKWPLPLKKCSFAHIRKEKNELDVPFYFIFNYNWCAPRDRSVWMKISDKILLSRLIRVTNMATHFFKRQKNKCVNDVISCWLFKLFLKRSTFWVFFFSRRHFTLRISLGNLLFSSLWLRGFHWFRQRLSPHS